MKKGILPFSLFLLIGGGIHAQTPPETPASVQQTAVTNTTTSTTAIQTAAETTQAQRQQTVPRPVAPAQPAFTQEQLDTALAPVALYPDSLLAQLLMATTYPDQVLQAAQWSKANPKMKGDEAVKAVQDRNWDASVASLVAFPQVLEMLSQKPEWVKELGEMFLADPDGVMSAIQGLRKKAYDAGNLKDTKEQKVVVQEKTATESSSSGTGNTTIIEIQPANPQTIYVPVYNPTVVYGPWWYPTPPFFWHPPYYNPVGAIIGFGAAIAIGHALWSHWDWHHHDININVNRYNNININRRLDIRDKQASWRQNIRERNPRFNEVKRDRVRDRMARPGERTRDLQRARARQELRQKGGIDLDRARDAIRKNPGQVNKAIERANRMRPSQPQLRERVGTHRPTTGASRPIRNIQRPSTGKRPVGQRPSGVRPSVKRPVGNSRPNIQRPVKRPQINRPAPRRAVSRPVRRPARSGGGRMHRAR